MVGIVREVLPNENKLRVDISKWEKRDTNNTEDIGYEYMTTITNDTNIHHEDGTKTTLEQIKLGQEVVVHPPRGNDFEGTANEVILKNMSYNETFHRLFSRYEDRLNISVIYNPEQRLSEKWRNSIISQFEDQNISPSPTIGWIPYEENHVAAYKKEFNIENFPVALVFNTEELVFQTDQVNELIDFLSSYESGAS